jgi:hypothetical protein
VADCIPFWDPADEITCHATVNLTGKTLCAIAGNPVNGLPRIGLPGAGAAVFGVVARDVQAGETVLVYRGNHILPVTAAAVLAAGAEVQSDAAGKLVALAAGKKVGQIIGDVADAADAQLAFTKA